MKTDIIVIGGGAAGLMAAISASENGSSVTQVERNDSCGRKLNITGKGRCNITNLCDIPEFLNNVVTNPRFLYKALTEFSPADTVAFFESNGVAVKEERGRRVFPKSDNAHDVTNCLTRLCRQNGVSALRGRATEIIVKDGRVTGVSLGDRVLECSCVILATGGVSYPVTGSTGDGFEMAKAIGHTIITPNPSLVPLVSDDEICSRCMGLTLKNVGVGFYDENNKKLYYEQGELLFTHFGVSGPVALSASARIKDAYPCTMLLDFKPALDSQTLDKRLLRDFSENKNRDFINSLNALLPQKLIEPFAERCGIEKTKKVHDITKEERLRIVTLLKRLPVTISGTRPIAEAVVTAGGVNVKEINPADMQSKLIDGLYFAGEVMDVDAYTGGYNLQIAFSTGRLAGKKASERSKNE